MSGGLRVCVGEFAYGPAGQFVGQGPRWVQTVGDVPGVDDEIVQP